eukprot:1161361-Pelagomonas_calceolata.AAC.9
MTRGHDTKEVGRCTITWHIMTSDHGEEDNDKRAGGHEDRTWTLCCVGFVFCSPTTPMTGTSDTCTLHKLPGPTL